MKISEKLRKFFGIGKIAVKEKLIYPFGFFVWAIIHPIGIFVSYFLWDSVYSALDKSLIKGFTFPEMVTYNLLTTIVGIATFSAVIWRIGSDVRYGKLIKKVTKPIKHVNYLLLRDISSRLTAVLLEAIPTLLIGFIFLPVIKLKSLNIFLGIISTIMAFLLNFYLYYFIGLFSFWTKKEKGLVRITMTITAFLDGGMIPLDLFPKTFQKIVSFLPFQYKIYSPVMIFLGKFGLLNSLRVLIIQAFWIMLFYFLQNWLFKKAYSRFSSVGA